TMRPRRADEVPRAMVADRPQTVAVPHDVADRQAQVSGRTAPTQQKVVELEAADEPAPARHGAGLAAVVHVAGVPLPEPARILAGGELERIPDGGRDP